MKHKIYVVIVTYNGMKWIDRCLCDLKKSSIPIETIVIDNESTDETVEYVKNRFPEVDLHVMEKNLGFGQANNYGIKLAIERECDFVYLLNQDAYVYPDMFEELLKVYTEIDHSRVGILTPLHLYRTAKKLDRHFKSYIGSAAPDIAEDVLSDNLKPYYLVEGVPAAGWLVPRTTLEAVGGFDPIFFHYGEDDNYIQRLNYHRKKTVVVPTAKMIHDRETFGNSELAHKDDIFRSLKTYYFLNINYNKSSLLRILSKIFLVHSYQTVKCICKFDFQHAFEYPSAMVRNILNTRKYHRSRAKNKTVGPNWLG